YATELSVDTCTLGIVPLAPCIEADLTLTVGGLLTGAEQTDSRSVYEDDPYSYFYVEGEIISVLAGVLVTLLGGIGQLVEGILFGTPSTPGAVEGVLGGLGGIQQALV